MTAHHNFLNNILIDRVGIRTPRINARKNVKHFTRICLALCLFSGTIAFAQQSPQAELKAMKYGEPFQASIFASEPMITNPAAIDVDTKGRVWVAEIQWYRKAAKDPPSDRIKVLEDTDGDGKADKVTVFADDVFCPMSICVAGDMVYVATSPDLWVYEDKNGDLKADGPPKKLLTGFGGMNHDHGAHSLVLGPDHKWWMSHGDAGFKVAGSDGSKIEFQWGAILRGELDGGKLETVAVNFRNPYEVCVSSFGEAFCSDNDNDGNFSVRICWILDGGNYGWFGGPPFARNEIPTRVPAGTPFAEHWHFRGYIPGYVPGVLVTGFGSPCGICYYEGDAFGNRYKNAALHADAGPREVRAYRADNLGMGKRATSEVFLTSEDNYFRPDDVCAMPDGNLLVSDWYDGGVGGHAYNNPDQGRIFLLRPSSGKKLPRVGKPGPFDSVEDAAEALKNPNLATQFLAREKLLENGRKSLPFLKKLLAEKDPNHRARALWVLDRLGGEYRLMVAKYLDQDDGQFRALAVRILRRHDAEFSDRIVALKNDPMPAVRREVLLSLRGLPNEQALPVLIEMASAYTGEDRYELETLNIAAKGREKELYAALAKGKPTVEKLSLLQLLDPQATAESLLARLSTKDLKDAERSVVMRMLGGIPSLDAAQAVMKTISNEKLSTELRRQAFGVLVANLSGTWKELAKQPEFAEELKKLAAAPAWRVEALNLIGSYDVQAAAESVMGIAFDPKADAHARAKAVEVVSQLRLKNGPEIFGKLLHDPQADVRNAALAGMINFRQWNPLKGVVTDKKTPEQLSREIVYRMLQLSEGALVVLRWIDDKQLSPGLEKQALNLAVNHPDLNIRLLYEKFIPEKDRPQRLGAAIKPREILAAQGNLARGEKIFFQSSAAQCKNCHRVNDQGGTLGPDLSQIGRKYSRETLLETILNPSKAIAPEYVPYLVETESGQVFAGFLIEKTEEQIILKDANSQVLRFPAKEVVTLAQQEKSLMPELILKDVTAQDAADLMAYLSSLNTSTQHVTRFRVLGPFRKQDSKGIDHDFGPEKQLANVNLTETHAGFGTRRYRWEPTVADVHSPPSVDLVKFAQDRTLPGDNVCFYALVLADSAAEQEAELQIASDDSCRVWVNGKQVHRYDGTRAIGERDKVKASFRKGTNSIVIKVENHQGPGGVGMSINSPSAVQLKTE